MGTNVTFEEIKINLGETKAKRKIYEVSKNGKTIFNDKLYLNLNVQQKKQIKSILKRMMIHKNYKSSMVRWRVASKYKYGEIKPKGHRFFFFLNSNGTIVVFFDNCEKKRGALPSKELDKIEEKKVYYEQEFNKKK